MNHFIYIKSQQSNCILDFQETCHDKGVIVDGALPATKEFSQNLPLEKLKCKQTCSQTDMQGIYTDRSFGLHGGTVV